MDVVKKLLRALAPRAAYEAVSVSRTVRRNRAVDQRLRGEARELPFELIADLKVVPGRTELLERMPRDAVVAEVGVADGELSRQILEVCRPRKLVLIDLWPESSRRYGDEAMKRTLANVEAGVRDGVVEVRRGYSWDMLAQLPDASLDWVYIDAAHDYDSVRKDLRAALPRMKPGGIIAGHDYTRWSGRGLSRWGVVEAVNGFCVEHGWSMIHLTHESHRHISYAIQRRPV